MNGSRRSVLRSRRAVPLWALSRVEAKGRPGPSVRLCSGERGVMKLFAILMVAIFSATSAPAADQTSLGPDQVSAKVPAAAMSNALARAVSDLNPLEAAQRNGFRVYEGRIQVHIRCESEEIAGTVERVLRQGGADGILRRDSHVQAWADPEAIRVVAWLPPASSRVERPMYVSRPPEPEPGRGEDGTPALLAGSRVSKAWRR